VKIGITGANGFVAWHLRCYLHSLSDSVAEVRLATRDTFTDDNELDKFVDGLDFIVHLAGVNRASDAEIVLGNVQPAEKLVETLERVAAKPVLLFSSSTHAVNPISKYGEAKKAISKLFQDWASRNKARCINLIIPHIFGEYGRPYYNSGVATFCNEIANGIEPLVNPDGQLELVHVQDLVELMLRLYQSQHLGEFRVDGVNISVPDIVDKVKQYKHLYLELGQFPDLKSSFDRALFNTFRSALTYDARKVSPKLHSDNRGWLVETFKANSGGQCFVSSTHSGITRGNHYHRRKVERFFVLTGKAEIKLRKLFTDEVISYQLDGESPSYVDIPTLHTHNITNIGDEELITLFWTDEFYDAEKPDTSYMDVSSQSGF
jgi:UDP-2-acetamido-2,6-beta-L-arabino-hexul-4-ose reductase